MVCLIGQAVVVRQVITTKFKVLNEYFFFLIIGLILSLSNRINLKYKVLNIFYYHFYFSIYEDSHK